MLECTVGVRDSREKSEHGCVSLKLYLQNRQWMGFPTPVVL